MQTHDDFDYARLQERAEQMVREKASQITAGKPGEIVLRSYEATNGVDVTQLPEDEQDIYRISVGGHDSENIAYCVYRGDPGKCAALLDNAAKAIREQFVTSKYEAGNATEETKS